MPGATGTPDPQAGPAAGATEGGAAAGDGTTGNAATGAGATTGSQISLTQAELDAIILNRTAQARKVASDSAEKARQWDEYQATQLSEAEKATAKAAAEAKRISDVNSKIEAKAAAAEIRLVAVEKGVRKEALPLVAQLLAGSSEITVADDGSVSGVESAVNKLLAEHKYLLADKAAGPARSGAEFTGEHVATSSEAIRAAEKAGKPQESIALKIRHAAGAA